VNWQARRSGTTMVCRVSENDVKRCIRECGDSERLAIDADRVVCGSYVFWRIK
jgi:ribosomal protein S27AE